MNDYSLVGDKIGKLLRQHRFVLIRQNKHLIWQSPDRRIFVCAKTPSDWRAEKNAIAAFNRCISSPPAPMVIAISDFERQEAAEKIAGQERQQQVRPGMGSGKQRHRSNGTGFTYYDPNEPLTEEEIAAREQAAIKAKAAAEQRRERKLRHRQERQAKKDEEQKQILLSHINTMLGQIQPSPSLPVVVKLGRRNLFRSTVGNFVNSFEKLRWQEIDRESEVEIIVGTRNHQAITKLTRLRNTSDPWTVTVLNYQKLPDGTMTTERRWCKEWTAFDEVWLPDGVETTARIEYRDGTKEFNIKESPDGTLTKERVEFPNGEMHFGTTITPDGTRMIERMSHPDGGEVFGFKRLSDGTTTVHIVRMPDGTEEVDVEL